MKRREKTLLAVLLVLAFIAMFLPNTAPFKHVINEQELLYEANKEGRYVSTDEIAQAIMENDPSYLLIDLRTPKEFAKFSIDGAINIPYAKIMDEANLDYFNQDVYTTVLFSNGSSLADQAWMRLRSYDYQGNKVMKGGLNEWYKTIINPQKPKDIATAEDEAAYLFRKGASIFFTGAQVVGNAAPSTKRKASSKPIVKRKKKEVSGGCG